MAATKINIADLAAELGTDPRTARKFMRSVTAKEDQPGKGSRWAINASAVKGLRTKFAKFEEARAKSDAAENAPADEVDAE